MGFECLVDQFWFGCVHIFEIHEDVAAVCHGCYTSYSLYVCDETRGTAFELPH